jgi:hypothetical protein
LFWSGAAVLTGEWIPLQNGHARLWDACPGALFPRGDLERTASAVSWFELQGASPLPKTVLPVNQVKVVGPGDFEKAVHNQSWPFGHSLVILEKPVSRR